VGRRKGPSSPMLTMSRHSCRSGVRGCRRLGGDC
jgi:hypothetical protein